MGELEAIEPEKPKKKERLDQLLRTFTVDDAVFIEKNRTVHTLFTRQQALFTALDPTLDAAFKTAWMLNIEGCESQTTDETMLDILREKTNALQQQITATLQLVDELEFYTHKAYPANPALWQEFGFKLRASAINSHSRFILWVYTMLRVLEDYEAPLLAAGMPATFKNNFDTALGNCAEAELQQEYTKRLRLRQTRLRVEQLNRLHTYLQRVQKAAAVVFASDEVKRKQYD